MATSKTDICNLALDLLSAGVVTNIEEPTTAQESLLARWYDQSRRKVLREHPWNFAAKRALIAASSTAPAFGYDSQYPVPTDFIRLLNIETDEGEYVDQQAYQFENNSILYNSDAAALRIRYVYDFEDVVHMDPLFIDLLAYEIALGVAYKVTDSNTVIDRVFRLQKDRAPMAKAIDGMERPPQRIERSRAITSRRTGSTRKSDRIIF